MMLYDFQYFNSALTSSLPHTIESSLFHQDSIPLEEVTTPYCQSPVQFSAGISYTEYVTLVFLPLYSSF